jgi:hypothetical protein
VGYKDTIKGNVIKLDDPVPFTDGTRVEITMILDTKLRKGSPKAILQMAGTLTHEESEAILKASQECRYIYRELWK